MQKDISPLRKASGQIESLQNSTKLERRLNTNTTQIIQRNRKGRKKGSLTVYEASITLIPKLE